jgi:hypothetical protein
MRQSDWTKLVVELVGDHFRAEVTTTAGRVNALGMLLSLLLVVGLSLTPILEAVVRLIRPAVELHVPILQLFISFLSFTLLCTLLLGYLDRGR